jgi:argininosuccinate lyase
MVRNGVPVREAHHAVADALKNKAAASGPAATADDYRTIGGASPAETQRVADAFLKMIEA